MKNSILFITLSLFIFSCGNQPTTNEVSELKETEVVVQKEVVENKMENGIDNTDMTDKLIQDVLVKEIEELNMKESSKYNKLDEKMSTLELNTDVTIEEILPVEDKIIPKDVSIEYISNTPNHDVWNTILKTNVSTSGKVNYSGMKSKLSDIESYISTLESLSDQSTWNRNEKLAYWINLYNAATVRLIVQNYPTSSITNINGGIPWDKKVVTISGKTYSLNQIENDIIRPTFKEPRIHFAVNCAAVSCPKIMNSAFTEDKLNYQLTKQTKSFINGAKNSITESSIEISKIFEWYAADFGSSIIDYLNKYSTTTINSDATITYNEYNWDLNE